MVGTLPKAPCHAESRARRLKSFTPSERVAIGLAVEAELGNRRGQRTDLAGGGLPQNFAEVPQGKETREIAADKAGFGNPETYRQAKAVVQNASPELIEARGERRGRPKQGGENIRHDGDEYSGQRNVVNSPECKGQKTREIAASNRR